MGRDAYVLHAQERMRRHLVDLQAVALLKPRDRDEALERPIDHRWPVETERSFRDLARHIQECPSGSRQLVFPLVKIQAAVDGHPRTWIRLSPGTEKLRERSAFFNQDASGGDQSVLAFLPSCGQLIVDRPEFQAGISASWEDLQAGENAHILTIIG